MKIVTRIKLQVYLPYYITLAPHYYSS